MNPNVFTAMSSILKPAEVVEEGEGVFLWKLEEFYPDTFASCLSPLFCFGGFNWMMSLFRPSNDSVMLLHLKRINEDPLTEVRYSLGIRTAQGGTEVWKSDTWTFGFRRGVSTTVIESSQLKRRRDELLPQGILTLELKLRLSETGTMDSGGLRLLGSQAQQNPAACLFNSGTPNSNTIYTSPASSNMTFSHPNSGLGFSGTNGSQLVYGSGLGLGPAQPQSTMGYGSSSMGPIGASLSAIGTSIGGTAGSPRRDYFDRLDASSLGTMAGTGFSGSLESQLSHRMTQQKGNQFYGPIGSVTASGPGPIERPVSFSSTNLESLSFDWSKLLEDQVLPDVKLKCTEGTFSAHRAVLTARSEVFAAIFQNKMPESETVDVTDLDAQVLDLFLRYLYTGKIQGLSEDLVPGMYVACDKYAVHSLKKACSDWMIAGLTEGNCVSLLTLADAHSDTPFRDQVVSFICGHEAIFLSEVWSSFCKNHKELAIEVYNSYVRRKIRTSRFPSCVQLTTP